MDEAADCIDCIGDEVDGQVVIDGEFLPFRLCFEHIFFQQYIEQAVLQRSDLIGIELAQDCEDYGITLSVPTITPSGTIPTSESAPATTLTATLVPTGV